ncbi:hypothetical protein VT84_32005 [Gemmata sp. SH-PL17]|uniref:hypothetical protein n=1 Tax=Gemmata sp. SH-PL17 TaxID=1630693 RepID=UPI00078CB11B|nr:hypothetical protein [Gemmata sp. SH-PL17]AMV29063.1 hypothetical protein VT84_32005 [Gemmata sp. SH-PL17]
MGYRKQHLPLIVLASGMLALGSGCTTTGASTDAKKIESKKPDVTQPGVLAPPQETTRPVSAVGPGGSVVPASGTAPAMSVGNPQAPTEPVSPLAKLSSRPERKVVATEMAVGWQNRIASLPDPVRNGRMSPGIVGQMFLFGGTKLEFAQADGTLTVDLVDETPRQPGQPAAKPERWQFSKEILRNLQARDETFGKSYVLFLPWPSYTPDVTRVRISARYDPENGHTLFSTPNNITFDTSVSQDPRMWAEKSNVSTPIVPGKPLGAGSMPGLGGVTTSGVMPISGAAGAPIPLGGAAAPSTMMPIQSNGPAPMVPIPQGGAMLPIQPNGAAPMMTIQPNGAMMPIPPGTVPAGAPSTAPAAPAGVVPVIPAAPTTAAPTTAAPTNPAPLPDGLPPLTITLPTRQ